MKNNDKILESLYTTIFSQKFNQDGTKMAVCDNYGHIGIYKLSEFLSAVNIDKVKLPSFKFKAFSSTKQTSSLYTLESSNDFLICAPINEIVGYKWKDLNENKGSVKHTFSLKIPLNNDGNFNSIIETNTLACDVKDESKRLFAGCGNGDIYNFDLDYNKLIHKYSGAHSDCIYQILLKSNGNELVSSSEDGEVRFWDLRAKTSSMSIKPFEDALCSRPNIGKFINCLSCDEDNWLVCGGGPKLALWHLRSLKPLSILDFENDDSAMFVPNVCRIHDNQIITGGNSSRLFFHTFENKLKTEIETSTNCIYDIALNTLSKSNKILSIAGNGTKIDICSNFSYKAVTLNF
jgi:THO complex subunit 6